jgi:hypothetical protein
MPNVTKNQECTIKMTRYQYTSTTWENFESDNSEHWLLSVAVGNPKLLLVGL